VTCGLVSGWPDLNRRPLRPEAKLRHGLPAPQRAWPAADRPWMSADVRRRPWRLSLTSSLIRHPPAPGVPSSPEMLGTAVKQATLKSLAAFLNTDGGTLIIGVADDRTIIGIEADIPRPRGSIHDDWRLVFDKLVFQNLGGVAMNYIDLRLEPWQGRTIAIVRCSPNKEPTWLEDKLYVRCTASTEVLSTRQAVEWYRQRWG